MSVDSGPESCFDFQDLESGKVSNLGRKRNSAIMDANVLVQI